MKKKSLILCVLMLFAICLSSCGKKQSNHETLKFSTTDMNGNPVTEAIFKDAKVTMINFWEPWCGPCVNEMPDLQKLYSNYKDQGFQIIGVYSTFEMDADAKQIVSQSGVKYPILRACDGLSQTYTDYFPTTIFVDSDGNIISDNPEIGSASYSSWEHIISHYL